MLNPIAATLHNPTKSALRFSLSIPAGKSLDDVADQLARAGLRPAPEPAADEIEEAPKKKAKKDPAE